MLFLARLYEDFNRYFKTSVDEYVHLTYYQKVERKCVVRATKFAEKQIGKLPKHIAETYFTWVRSVQFEGIRAVRKLPGYHDEPLKGSRTGQRSVRLSRSCRVIYEETDSGDLLLIGVLEVNKHDY